MGRLRFFRQKLVSDSLSAITFGDTSISLPAYMCMQAFIFFQLMKKVFLRNMFSHIIVQTGFGRSILRGACIHVYVFG